jgi:hypothetical protein
VRYGITLAETDRERYRCPEVLNCDLGELMLLEARDLQAEVGLAPEDLMDLLSGTPVLNEDGTPKLADDGKTPLKSRDLRAVNPPLVWLGLRRAGISVPYAELDFQYLNARIWFPPERPDVDPGKDPSTPENEPDNLTD